MFFFVRFQCFKAAWVTTVLHQGFKFPQNYSNLRSAFYIGDKEVQWTLGAILYRTRFLPLRYVIYRRLMGLMRALTIKCLVADKL